MPYYKPLKELSAADRSRTLKGLKRIRQQFVDLNLPGKKTEESLILGTWNIRNFDDDRFNYGPRTAESMQYIAEIISRFDVIAVQEICSDLQPLKRLLGLLGKSYDFHLTDVTHSGLGGNKERLGFIYDRDKVSFKGVSGEIVLPQKMAISEELGKPQFARTPFGVEFQSGWFKFLFSTVHIYYGNASKSSREYARRVKEVDAVAKYLAKEARASDANQILVGDFNILEPGSLGYDALEKNGFTTVKNREGSNKDRTKFYDQISFQSRRNELVLLEPDREDHTIQFFDSVYRPEDFELYQPVMRKMIGEKLKMTEKALAAATSKTARDKAERTIKSLKAATASESEFRKYYNEWRTFQMSDHLPLWVEVYVDFSDSYLKYLETWKPE